MLDRCDLRDRRECSCHPSGEPCRVQSPILAILADANTEAAGRTNYWFIALVAFVGITVFTISAKTGFDRQARAYEVSGRV